MKRTGNVGVETKWTVDLAIESVNSIKKDMLKSGNHISRIVHNIKDALKEREACKKFAISTGMSKASISKMLTAETLRDDLSISHEVSYNSIYKVKDLLDIDKVTSDMVVAMLNDGKTENDIRLTLIKSEDTAEDTPEDTTEGTAEDSTEDTAEDTTEDNNIIRLANEAKEIKSQVFDILSNYNISKEDMKLIKMLMQSLR